MTEIMLVHTFRLSSPTIWEKARQHSNICVTERFLLVFVKRNYEYLSSYCNIDRIFYSLLMNSFFLFNLTRFYLCCIKITANRSKYNQWFFYLKTLIISLYKYKTPILVLSREIILLPRHEVLVFLWRGLSTPALHVQAQTNSRHHEFGIIHKLGQLRIICILV